MGEGKSAGTRTSRILSTYHFFRYCEEVEFDTLCKAFSISKKTAYRDIRMLEQAGVLQARFDKTQRAFVPTSLEIRPMEPEKNATRLKYLAKIRRICILMAELDHLEGSPIEMYRKLFPLEKDRTRQRDFAELGKMGYAVKYEAAFMDEPGYWNVEIPPAFGLDTIPEDVNWW